MSLENYTGHKAIKGVYQKIINEIPKHQRYVELCAGSAKIFSLMTVPAETVILNDLDAEVQQQLKQKYPSTTVTNVCGRSMLEQNLTVWYHETFIFIDPPYLHSTRTNIDLYKHEMTDDDHKQLLSAVLKMNCNVMLIHPKCDLYDTMLKDWRKVEIKIRYHRKTSIECLYMNYAAVQELQTDEYLGKDCWDRQRIKRKGDRIVAKLKKLPVLERNYVLNRLNELK